MVALASLDGDWLGWLCGLPSRLVRRDLRVRDVGQPQGRRLPDPVGLGKDGCGLSTRGRRLWGEAMSKGSSRRPAQVPKETVDANWNRIFPKPPKPPKEKAPNG